MVKIIIYDANINLLNNVKWPRILVPAHFKIKISTTESADNMKYIAKTVTKSELFACVVTGEYKRVVKCNHDLTDSSSWVGAFGTSGTAESRHNEPEVCRNA